ncbi:hypothetical protein [Streptomyces sp. NPDC005283]|uniref:hypothetical protein n=1 Tax=Streptomyces sp. NPDC005283 TaxID=3156871 RepID=UPI0034530D02
MRLSLRRTRAISAAAFSGSVRSRRPARTVSDPVPAPMSTARVAAWRHPGPQWTRTTVLRGVLRNEVQSLKSGPGGDIAATGPGIVLLRCRTVQPTPPPS